MMPMKFYKCKNCNQVHVKLIDYEMPAERCSVKANEIIPNNCDGDKNIHVPQIRKIGNFVTITVGKEEHPMVDIHYISFILLETNQGVQYKYLNKNAPPLVDFIVANDEEIVNVYVYCTIHSLWSLH